MPAPDPRPEQPARAQDLSAIPAFLRAASRPATTPDASHSDADGAASPGVKAGRAALAIPRPVTPKPATEGPKGGPSLDPASLPMPSLSRRRVITAAGILLAGVLGLTFAQQVGEATAASARADELRAANAALRGDVERLERDLGQVQDLRFIRLEGRAYGLGGKREIPFALAEGAPPLAPDAPGSASVRLGAEQAAMTPLDAWLDVLFGEDR
ncbi:MAG TPA: hypothetical protein VMQ65_06060 [Candidatus Limnocylindria bacterium]|nr:hypothetical protein [Candidatus Limnocylindria bacterium]